MINKLILGLVINLLLCITKLHGQDSTPAANGIGSGSEGTVTFTVGQLIYSSHSGGTGTIAEGIQQPYEIFVITSLEESYKINLSVLAYPNPTTGILNLKIENGIFPLLSYELYDQAGKLLKKDKIFRIKNDAVIEFFDPGVYFLHINQGNKIIKMFKIIKK